MILNIDAWSSMRHSCLKENLIKVFEKLQINTEIWGLLGHGDRHGTKLSSAPHLRSCKKGTGKIYLLGPSRKAVPTSGNFRRSICLLGTNHILLKVLSIKRHLSLMISASKVWTPIELGALQEMYRKDSAYKRKNKM